MIKVIIGTQWGDEGKGKFVDYFAQKAKIVARYNGSGGAAHSVINNYGKFKLHLLPSGIFSPKTKVMITNGVVVEPELLLSEIRAVEKAGIKVKGRLFISPRCHLVFPYHKILDSLTNALFASDQKTSPTTARGNGPVNADKISYQGIRIYDLVDEKRFRKRLQVAINLKNKFIKTLGGEEVNYQEILSKYLAYAKLLKRYIYETLALLEKAVVKGEEILFEGVNGFFLDNDWGAYPFVTTASILPTEVSRGSGINPYLSKHEIIGVAKAYMTRVDNGECPLPTEWREGPETKAFRDMAGEYASGTGRPRRIAWFDAEVVKTCHRLCHLDYLCLTRLDTLAGLKKLKICYSYQYKNKKVSYLDGDAEFYRRVKPKYIELEGWNEEISNYKKYAELPKNVRVYIETIEKLLGVRIKYISVGPNRNQTIQRHSGKSNEAKSDLAK